MKISIIGATGVLARQLMPRLIERAHEVKAVVRTQDQAAQLQRLGVQTFTGDILVRESLLPAVADAECVLHLATSIPRDLARGDWTANDLIRRKGTENLLGCATEKGVRRYIQQSITLLYGDCGAQIVDESRPLAPSPYIQSAFEMEQLVQERSLEWCILRGGNFYGPFTKTEDAWREQARSGQLRIPKNGEALISLIHVVDMARAVLACAEEAKPGSIYNVVDDCPVSYRELFSYVAHQGGSPDPEIQNTEMPSLSCTNNRIKSELGWQPAFASFRSGLALS